MSALLVLNNSIVQERVSSQNVGRVQKAAERAILFCLVSCESLFFVKPVISCSSPLIRLLLQTSLIELQDQVLFLTHHPHSPTPLYQQHAFLQQPLLFLEDQGEQQEEPLQPLRLQCHKARSIPA